MKKHSEKIVKHLLLEEIKKSHAPVTGFLVACGIITKKGIYFGHNFEEEDPVKFQHAETHTVQKMLQNEKSPEIQKIIMAGGGRITKFKNYTPCSKCTDALFPYVNPETIIELIPLPNTTASFSLQFKDLLSSYQNLAFSRINNLTKELILQELRLKTLLKDTDISLVADVTDIGLKSEAEVYLTGSSSGRGGISTFILDKTNCGYRDIDIIIVANSNYTAIQEQIEDTLLVRYGHFESKEKLTPTYKNRAGVIIKNIIYNFKNNTSILDLTFTTNFKGSFRQQIYEEKNWFHQLA